MPFWMWGASFSARSPKIVQSMKVVCSWSPRRRLFANPKETDLRAGLGGAELRVAGDVAVENGDVDGHGDHPFGSRQAPAASLLTSPTLRRYSPAVFGRGEGTARRGRQGCPEGRGKVFQRSVSGKFSAALRPHKTGGATMSDSTSRESAGAGAEGIWPWKRTGKTATSPATGISTGSARRDYRVRGQPMRRSGTGGVELHDRWMRAGRLLARRDETGSSGDCARTAAGRRAAAQYESRRSKWQCALQAKGTSRDVRRCRRGYDALPPCRTEGRGEPRFGEPSSRAPEPPRRLRGPKG